MMTLSNGANFMKNQVSYPRKQIIEVLRTLNELVVSLDRIGSASRDMTKVDSHAALWDFIRRHDIFRKAARARRILSEPFPATLGPDDMEELEREMQDVPHWKAKKRK
jgi:hypothetical protein